MRIGNQLESLGEERDLHDAEALRGMFAIWGPDSKRPKSPSNDILRRTLLVGWLNPRLPYPCFNQNLPIEYPWSKDARDHFFKGEPGSKLTLDHVKPISYMIREVLIPAAANPECTDQMFLELLRAEYSNLRFTVLTKIEDRRVDKCGSADTYIDYADEWERYAVAGIDPSDFMMLTDDPRFDAGTMTSRNRGRTRIIAPTRSSADSVLIY